MNTKGTFVVVLTSVSTKPAYQRITLDCCRTFNRLWDAEDYYNSLITEVFSRHTNGYDFDNYDRCACDIYTSDEVNYHIELKEV
jgi:hypothetical protein